MNIEQYILSEISDYDKLISDYDKLITKYNFGNLKEDVRERTKILRELNISEYEELETHMDSLMTEVNVLIKLKDRINKDGLNDS